MSGTTVAGALADEQGDRSATPGSDSPSPSRSTSAEQP